MGKKKAKKKSSSKSKKGTNESPASPSASMEPTPAINPSSEKDERETDLPPTNSAGEDIEDLNPTVPDSVSAVEEASSELGGADPQANNKSDAPTTEATDETNGPAIDETISPDFDERENIDDKNSAGNSVSPTEEAVTPGATGLETGDAEANAEKNDSDEANAEHHPKTNDDGVINDDIKSYEDEHDEESTVFEDARYCETFDSKDGISPFETDGEKGAGEPNTGNKPERNTEIKAGVIIDCINENDNDSYRNSNRKKTTFLNAEITNMDVCKDEIPPVETSGKNDDDETNTESKPELRAEPKVKVAVNSNNSNGNSNDEEFAVLNAERTERSSSTDEISPNDNSNGDSEQVKSDDSNRVFPPKESDGQRNTNSQSESNTAANAEAIKAEAQSTDSKTALAFKDDTEGKYKDIDGNDCDNETSTTYLDGMPLFHYSRIVGSGLPKGIENVDEERNDTALIRRSMCSELAVVRVNREMLVSSTSNASTPTTTDFNPLSRANSTSSDNRSTESSMSAAAIRRRQREQALLLSSDLWFQPHSIAANGYGGAQGGYINFTRLIDDRGNSQSCSSAPSIVFATPHTSELGGIIDSSSHGKSSSQKYASVSTVLYLRDGENRAVQGSSVVDMSFDASGSVFGAIDRSGHCGIWELNYTTSLQSSSLVFGDPDAENDDKKSENFYTPSSTPIPTRPQVSPHSSGMRPAPSKGIFSNFMSALTGIPPSGENAAGSSNSTHSGTNNINNSNHGSVVGVGVSAVSVQPETLVPALTAEISNLSRINYPAKWGSPTCLAIDPAYKLKREKSIVVGFANGQLYLTKKGTFFQRRNDTMIYQAGNRGEDSYHGIETVVWRGSLVAFADATGIKLIDSDHLTRIAHINRPVGASPYLYPLIRDISPSLVFETARHLLVGWGDCLMQIYVEEYDDDVTSSAFSIQSGGSNETGSSSKDKKKIKRTAACTMAWELDCVACDIVPLDGDHVVVLGLVSLVDGVGNDEEITIGNPSHDLELQILSRKDGTISYSDSLPLIDETKVSDGSSNPIASLLSVKDFRLLSSFALPRREEAEETKALKALKGTNDMGFVGIDVSFDMNQPLFGGTDSFLKKGIEFRDPHLEWNIESIMYDKDNDDEMGVLGSSGDDSSIDSDDYECILRPMETIRPLSSLPADNATAQSTLPPTMVVCTELETILSVTSTIDDSIEYSLDNHKYAQALTRGLRHKRQLRRYNLDDLINYYLEAVLRIHRSTTEQGDTNTSAVTKQPQSSLSSSLSLRRMQLAVKAMPVLLGGRIELWERWAKELENIPGAIFFLRKYLPVRDPILPSRIYIRILKKMVAEVEHLFQTSKMDNRLSIEMHAQAAKHFLESLVAWGPTKVLKECISYYKYNKERRKGEKDLDDDVRSTEISLQRRYLQTAAGYLIFPVRDIEEEFEVSAPRYEVLNVDTEDSLFDIAEAVAVVASRVPIVESPDDFMDSGSRELEESYTLAPNNHTCLDAMARLRMMQGEFDLALKCFLAIGAFHSTDPIESFEASAIQIVNGTNNTMESVPTPIGNRSYEFVMNLIERHELNQFLFEKDFLLSTDSKLFVPIFALIRLVGLRSVGNFLTEHCVAAGFTYSTSLSEMNAFNFSEEDSIDEPKGILRRGSLPIDKVAEQLENSPAILHWYLHLVFTRRPDFYIKIPTNAVPSKAVKDLHRKHFQLYVDFAGDMRDSSKVLAEIEAYKVDSKTTPLLTFLKAALPLGGVMPVDARRVLEIERSRIGESDEGGNTGSEGSSSPVFALELAYIIEKYSDETETEAMGILNLYLKGAKSLPLAVSYAQRQKKFHSKLWDHLISHCLREASDGTMYGELLKAAALTGADLARLVERIPPGMVVEGLRPRLVAAVADYRMKLEIYEAAMAAGSEEQMSLMRQIGHRARRGLRYDVTNNRKKSFAELIAEKVQKDEKAISNLRNTIRDDDLMTQPQSLSKTRLRRDHKSLSYSIPRR